MSETTYPAIDVEQLDDESKAFGQAINWQNETIAKTHAMVAEMYQIFEQLKPLMNGMPKMTGGFPMPGMIPPLNGRMPGR